MVDRYAKFGTEHLFAAASRIEIGGDGKVAKFPTFSPRSKEKGAGTAPTP
jgi:hypothetical protein